MKEKDCGFGIVMQISLGLHYERRGGEGGM